MPRHDVQGEDAQGRHAAGQVQNPIVKAPQHPANQIAGRSPAVWEGGKRGNEGLRATHPHPSPAVCDEW